MRNLPLHYRHDRQRTCLAEFAQAQQLHAGQERSERVAQFVAERGQEFVLALVAEAQGLFGPRPLTEVRSDLVLPLARAQRGAHGTQQRGDPQGPLQNGDVAQPPHRLAGGRGCGSGIRQDKYRQVGPGRLVVQYPGQLSIVLRGDGLLGNDQHAHPLGHFLECGAEGRA